MKKSWIKLPLLSSPLLEWLDTPHALRLYLHKNNIQEGKREVSPASHKRIKNFIDHYEINTDDFEPSDPEQYGSSEEFFVRKHREGARPRAEADNDKRAVCVADPRVVAYG